MSKSYWLRVLEAFGVAAGGVFVAQLADIQGAVNAGDWSALKKLGIAALSGAFVAGAQAAWLLINPTARKALK